MEFSSPYRVLRIYLVGFVGFVGGFGWFWVVLLVVLGGFGWFWVVLGGFGWFRVLVTTEGRQHLDAAFEDKFSFSPLNKRTTHTHIVSFVLVDAVQCVHVYGQQLIHILDHDAYTH